MGVSDPAARLYEAYNRHDPTGVAELYATDATHQDIAQGNTVRGPRAIADGLRRFFTWFPDAHWEPRSWIVDPGGAVAVTYLLTATLQAPMGPIPAQGQRLSLRGAHVLHLAGDRIRGSEDYWDAATFKDQISHTNPGGTA
jgi:SnoaL-like polyketide cyclase.